METRSSLVIEEPPLASNAVEHRREGLQERVNAAAKALYEQGIRPTVARVRAALGGGSPNDLTPAVKHWREAVLPRLPVAQDRSSGRPALPLQVADLVYELWQRATAAALVEVRGGPTTREVAARTGEAQGLRQQISALRDQLQRESLAYGELRAQAARHEAIARDALVRANEGESRERELLRTLGELRQRVAELEAVVQQAMSKPAARRKRSAGNIVRGKRVLQNARSRVTRARATRRRATTMLRRQTKGRAGVPGSPRRPSGGRVGKRRR